MSDQIKILPARLADTVGLYVERELDDIAKYDNREALDESAVSGLMRLAAEIYMAGYSDGSAAQNSIEWAIRRIGRARAKSVTE